MSTGPGLARPAMSTGPGLARPAMSTGPGLARPSANCGSLRAGDSGRCPTWRSASHTSSFMRVSISRRDRSMPLRRDRAQPRSARPTETRRGRTAARDESGPSVPKMRRRLVAKAIGTIGAPARRATLTMPVEAHIAGPRGPSGVIPTQSPASSRFSIVRSADEPPRRLEPAIECTPKWLTASAMMRPSRCAEISMCIGASRCHAIGIIIMRPCQKARMKPRPSRRSRRGISPPSTVQRLVR